MAQIELLENLLETANSLSYENRNDLESLEKRTEMIVRKLFGDESHYIRDLKSIRYSPIIMISGVDSDYKGSFEHGVQRLRTLIQVMIEDIQLSSNYNNIKTVEFIKSEQIPIPDKKSYKEIKVLVASPGDVKRERELLLDKLETKFRRENYEERCGARIIVNGWEYVASQSGYAQDIINSDLVSQSNIVLAIFRHKLGSPTIDIKTGKDRSPSGTAEEILYAIRNKAIKNPPLGMAYFYANAPVLSLDSIDFKMIQSEWDRLKEFKEEIKNEILYKPYNNEEEILEIVCKDICQNILKYFP